MESEIHADPTAYRRHRRGMLLFLLAFVLYVPAVLLGFSLLKAALGRGTAGPYAGAVLLAGFVGLMGTMFYGGWHSLAYRCPRCGRRLPRVVPRGEPEPNLHYHCADCRVIWDLGW